MQQSVVALDVGGTMIKGAVVDRDGAVLHELRAPTPRHVPAGRALDGIAHHLGSLIEAAGADAVVGICVAVPGILDEDSGTVRSAANLGWHDVPVATGLSARLEREVRVAHDVRAGGLAESRVGAATGVRDSLFVAIGTGIAAAAVVDGIPLRAQGRAGEIGHVQVSGHRAPCRCGRRGCLETIASALGIERAYAARTGSSGSSAADVADRVTSRDPVAMEVWSEATDALGQVLATCVAVLGSQVVVLGGGLSNAGPLLLDPVAARLDLLLGAPPSPPVLPAALGDAAGCLGAAMLAWPSARDVVTAGERT